MQSFSPGTQVSHFRLLEKIGSGSTGDVFRAEDIHLRRPVALKILTRIENTEQEERFLREARLCSSLIHPNIAIVYEAGWHEQIPFLALELVEGRMLSREIRDGKVDRQRAIGYAKKILDALGEAHRQGILHRDIKSSNIMITPQERLKVLDFGLAKNFISGDSKPQLTRPGTIIGTIEFLSPEQARGEAADARSDLFSAGVVLYHMLSGHLPYESEQTVSTYAAILHKPPIALRTFLPDVSDALEQIMLKALARSPDRRYQTAAAFIHDLDLLLDTSLSAGLSPAELQPMSGPIAIAALYFDRIGQEEQGEYLRIGITEDIITDLSKIAGVSVLSRHAVQKYKDKDDDPIQILKDLNVDYLLYGAVEKSSERIRIKAQLIRKPDGQLVWSDTYDRQIQDIFELQEEVARRITEALQIHLTDSEKNLLHHRSTENLEAYELYLRGRHHYNLASPEDNRMAENMLSAATRLDPQFASAHAALSETYVQRFYNWFDRDRAWLSRAEEVVNVAYGINDQLPEVHSTLGMLLYLRGEYEKAMQEVQKAIRLDPYYALAHDHTGEMYLHTGELEKAILAFHTELRINPDVIYPYFYLVWIHSLLGDFSIARDILEKGKVKHSGNPLLPALEGIEASYEGRLEEAEEKLQRAIAQNPGNSFSAGRLAVVYAEMKQWEKAFRIAEKATEQIDPLDHHAAFDRACVLSLFGNAIESLHWLDRAVDLGWRCAYHFWNEKNLAAVRKTAGFQNLIRKLPRSSQ